ncbi:MAG: beta-lactamase family protein [Alphaproteobacteria bacterium]|nr:beta-lactamase family protein [Alphaproteobacteria bacterium]
MPDRRVHGAVHPAFRRVADVFEQNLRQERGAALCVTVAGETVVDLWAGEAREGAPWEADTLCTVFSATKGLVALAFLRLVEQERLGIDDRVADHWPEFAAHGKGGITVRELLEHRSGIAWVEQPLSLTDLATPEILDRVLADERPGLPRGTQAYGATAWGLYAGALYRRITGESVGQSLQRDVLDPLGADCFLGLPPEQGHRLAHLGSPNGLRLARSVVLPFFTDRGHDGRIFRNAVRARTPTAKAIANPRDTGRHGLHNLHDPGVLATELPWAGATCTARGLCRVYTALANGGSLDGVSIVDPTSISAVVEDRPRVRDRVIHKHLAWNRGFLKEDPGLFSRTSHGFGHPGAGGSLGWADPADRLAIAYVMNRMDPRLRSPRSLRLCRAVQQCLGAGR